MNFYRFSRVFFLFLTYKAGRVLLILLLISGISRAQSEKELRINLLNPGIAWELPVAKNKTIEFNTGIGYNYSYPEINTMYEEGGFQW